MTSFVFSLKLQESYEEGLSEKIIIEKTQFNKPEKS